MTIKAGTVIDNDNAKILLKIPVADNHNVYPEAINNYLNSHVDLQPNPDVFLKGFVPIKKSKEELEMTKRYLKLDDRVKTRLFKDSVIKGRRHTNELNHAKLLI